MRKHPEHPSIFRESDWLDGSYKAGIVLSGVSTQDGLKKEYYMPIGYLDLKGVPDSALWQALAWFWAYHMKIEIVLLNNDGMPLETVVVSRKKDFKYFINDFADIYKNL